MLEQQVDGLILVGSVFRERTGNKHILTAGRSVPVVLINSFLEGENIYSILCDEGEGIREAVNYLVKLGHRDIYYFIDTKSFSGLAKLEGFRRGRGKTAWMKEKCWRSPGAWKGEKRGSTASWRKRRSSPRLSPART